MNKATLHIEEDEEGLIQVSCDLEPELTDAQREGDEDLPFSHYLAGIVIEGIGGALDRLGMERLETDTPMSD